MTENDGATRRDLLRGGALGVGALVGGAGAVTLAQQSNAATPAFSASATTGQQFWLAVSGVTGPGTARGFVGQLPISSFSFGFDEAGSTGGAGTGTVTPTTLDFTTPTSKATPQLLADLITGKVVPKATLTGLRPNASGVEQRYLIIVVHNLLVSSLHTSESHGAPTDHVSFKFDSITVTIDSETVTYSVSHGGP